MFWGLTLEPGKRYAQEVQNSFHISMAALDVTNSKENNVATMVEVDKNEFVMCTLNKSNTMQQPIDLNFMKGTEVAFFTQGKGSVHLTGFLIPDEDAFGDYGEEEESSDEEAPQLQLAKGAKNGMDKKRKGEPTADKVSPASKKLKAMAQQIMNGEDLDSDDDDDEDFEEEEDDDSDDEEGEQGMFVNESMEDSDEDEEDSDEEAEEEEDDESEDEEEAAVPVKQGKQKTPQKQTPQKQQQQQQQQKTPNSQKKGAVTPKEQSAKKGDKQTPKQSPKQDVKAQGTPAKKTLHGGVVIEDMVVGNGPAVAAGKQVAVYYVGRNKHNNKQFDATQSGPPFKFRLGKGDVIKGWDIGVQGMKVGGKRRVICPPHMAYGNKGSPPVIPPNSTLVFDIELKGIS